jgi:hypothetical protein
LRAAARERRSLSGDEPVKVVGFFCAPEIISTFAEAVQPIGEAALNQGAPVAV